MAPRLTQDARTLLRRQRGLIADWQAPAVGLSRRSLMDAATQGEWSRVSGRVFADHVHDLQDRQLRVAGPLEVGPWAVLGGCAALVEAGWTGSARDWVDVIEPRGQRRRRKGRPPWLRTHQPRDEVRGSGLPRRCSVPRAAVDGAVWSGSDREAVMILASVVQQRLTTADAMLGVLRSRHGLPRTALIREALQDISGGATSSNELAFRRECRERRLPVPRMQVRRVQGTRRTDAEFTSASGRLVIVEIDGLGHLGAQAWQDDITRHNELAVTTGALILRVTGWEVRNDPDPFFGLLTRVLGGQW